MISQAEILRSLNGVWLLFLGRPEALKYFDPSIDGFWKSFQAFLLLAPLYAFSTFVDWLAYTTDPDVGPSFDGVAFVVSQAVTVAIDWVTLPLLLALLGGFLGIRAGYTGFVVVRNWAAPFAFVPQAIISLSELFGVFPGYSILVPAGVALAISLRISYLTARMTLQTTIDVAIAYAALDFLVSLALAEGIARLFGVDG